MQWVFGLLILVWFFVCWGIVVFLVGLRSCFVWSFLFWWQWLFCFSRCLLMCYIIPAVSIFWACFSCAFLKISSSFCERQTDAQWTSMWCGDSSASRVQHCPTLSLPPVWTISVLRTSGLWVRNEHLDSRNGEVEFWCLFFFFLKKKGL